MLSRDKETYLKQTYVKLAIYLNMFHVGLRLRLLQVTHYKQTNIYILDSVTFNK